MVKEYGGGVHHSRQSLARTKGVHREVKEGRGKSLYLGIRTKANRFQFKHILYCFEPLYTVPYVQWCERTEINYSLFLDYYLVTGIKTNGHDFLRIVIEIFYYVLTNKNESSMIKPLIKNRMIRRVHYHIPTAS